MSAFSSHASNSANGAARDGGNPAAQLCEGTACNTMQVAENIGERFVNFANSGPSVLDGLAAPFANYRISTVKSDIGFNKKVTRALGSGERVLSPPSAPPSSPKAGSACRTACRCRGPHSPR